MHDIAIRAQNIEAALSTKNDAIQAPVLNSYQSVNCSLGICSDIHDTSGPGNSSASAKINQSGSGQILVQPDLALQRTPFRDAVAVLSSGHTPGLKIGAYAKM